MSKRSIEVVPCPICKTGFALSDVRAHFCWLTKAEALATKQQLEQEASHAR